MSMRTRGSYKQQHGKFRKRKRLKTDLYIKMTQLATRYRMSTIVARIHLYNMYTYDFMLTVTSFKVLKV